MIPTASACPTLHRLGGHSARYGADEEPVKGKGDDEVGRTPATGRARPRGGRATGRGAAAPRPSGAGRRGPRWAGVGELSREPHVGESRVDDLGVFDDRDEAHAAATARAGEHVDVEGAPHQGGPRPAAGSAGEWRVCITAGCAVVERPRRSGRTVRPGGPTAAGSIATKLEQMWRGGVGGGFLGRRAWAPVGDGAAAPNGHGGRGPRGRARD